MASQQFNQLGYSKTICCREKVYFHLYAQQNQKYQLTVCNLRSSKNHPVVSNPTSFRFLSSHTNRPGHGPKNPDPKLTGILIKGTCKYEQKKIQSILLQRVNIHTLNKNQTQDQEIVMIRYVVFSKKFQNKDPLCNKIFQL